MDPMSIIANAKARRAASGFIADNGIYCRSANEVAYYNARDKAQRDDEGRIVLTPELRALKAAAAQVAA